MFIFLYPRTDLQRGAVCTSPAINLTLAFSYFFPLLFSIVTHPAKSIKVWLSLRIKVQSDFQLKPVALQAISQSEAEEMRAVLLTFQTNAGIVRSPSGRAGNFTPFTSSYTWTPSLFCKMQLGEQANSFPVTSTTLRSANLTQIVISLLRYFFRMEFLSTRLFSKFCSRTLTFWVVSLSLKARVSGQMVAATSSMERKETPASKLIPLVSLTMAQFSLQIVRERLLRWLMAEERANGKRSRNKIFMYIVI